MFQVKDSRSSVGHHMLQTFTGRGVSAGQIIGIRVVFPKTMGLGTKSFTYSVYGTEEAVKAALIYRDTTLQNKLSSLN